MALPQFVRIIKSPIRLALCTAFIAALGVFCFPQASMADTDPTVATTNSVVAPIGTNDTLHVDVVGQTDLSRDYQVDANGDITMLYVGKLHVGGLTPDQATTTIQNALGKIYVNPAVTLSRSSMGGSSVTITGSVQKQGSTVVRRDAHLNDVVQQAQPTADADLSKIQITRGLPGEEHSTLTSNLAAFLSSGSIADNPQLQDGDVVFVPNKTPITYSVSIVGAIVKPGRYDVQPNTTVYDVIKLAGGLEEEADRSTIYVQPIGTLDRHPFDYDKARQSPEDATLNPVLKDGDKVVISENSVTPTFSITGGVLKPGEYPIRGKLSLTDAYGLAGGTEDHAKLDQITVTREASSGAQVLKVNAKDPTVAANFLLEPGDNVFIPRGSAPSKLDPLELLGVVVGLYGILK